jgi:AcrR family transcriptional regulator
MPKSHQALTKPDPGAYHHGDLRNALIEAGLAVLREHGAAGLNLREVARRAGVSHAAPYRHFADKEALVAAIALEGFEKLARAIQRTDSQHAEGSAFEKLLAAGETYTRFAIDHADHFRIMFTGERSPETHPDLYAASKRGFLYLISVVQAGQQAGAFRAGDPVDIAKMLWVTMHGIATLINDGQLPMLGGSIAQRRQAGSALARQTLTAMFEGLSLRQDNAR